MERYKVYMDPHTYIVVYAESWVIERNKFLMFRIGDENIAGFSMRNIYGFVKDYVGNYLLVLGLK